MDNSKTTNLVANIFLEALDKKRNKLMRIYQHMVLSKDLNLSPDMRIKKAFSHLSDEECTCEQNRLEDYVRGGLEILDECFSSCHTYEDICNSFHDLMDKIIDYLNCESTN